MSLQSSTIGSLDRAGALTPVNESKPFATILSGANAFYNAPKYLESTRKDFAVSTTLPATYTWNTEHKIIRIVKQILSIIIFPIAIYQLLHALAGKFCGLLPASTPFIMGLPSNHADECRVEIPLESKWKYKRITVEVDGYEVDAAIVGKASTFENGRWVLASNGNGEFYEDKMASPEFQQILTELNGNAIVFNYPGVGASSGLPSRQAMEKAYRAMLAFLEDKEKGIGAKEIIGYGHSIGGGAQGDALLIHELKKDIKYVFVKSRTFSDLSSEVSHFINRFLGILVRVLGWNMDSVESSKKLQAPEIIMQTADVQDYEELKDSAKVRGDGVIPARASLAKALLDDPECPRNNKFFMGMPEGHNTDLVNPAYLTGKIEDFLAV